MSTNADKRCRFYLKRRLLILLLLIYLVWYVAVPRVKVYFSDEESGKLEFVLNTQNDIFRGEIFPTNLQEGLVTFFPMIISLCGLTGLYRIKVIV